jgi:hypothetical protein
MSLDRRTKALLQHPCFAEIEAGLRSGKSPETVHREVSMAHPETALPSAKTLRRYAERLKRRLPGAIGPSGVQSVQAPVLPDVSEGLVLSAIEEIEREIAAQRSRIGRHEERERKFDESLGSAMPYLSPDVRHERGLLRQLLRDRDALGARLEALRRKAKPVAATVVQSQEDAGAERTAHWIHDMDSETFMAMLRELFPAPPDVIPVSETVACDRSWCIAAHAAGEKPCRG